VGRRISGANFAPIARTHCFSPSASPNFFDDFPEHQYRSPMIVNVLEEKEDVTI
jgi:hypothetical protein